MKLRILNNSIRIRLSQEEVNQLSKGLKLSSILEFPGQTNPFCYSIIPQDISMTSVKYVGNCISISINKDLAKQWANSSSISLEEHLNLTEEKKLKVLIEKDFKCLTKRPDEDESGLFPNPNRESLKC